MTVTDKPFWRSMAARTGILRVDCGSRGFGLHRPASDHDHKVICVEDLSAHVRLADRFDNIEEKIGIDIDSDYPQGIDLQFLALDKFIGLVLNGNPTMLTVLFSPPIYVDARGLALQALAPKIVSRKAGKAFLGYMQTQRKRVLGELGQLRVHRPELVKAHGFDTKYMYHVLRLGFQGIELLKTGKITMPYEGEVKDFLMMVRGGEVNLASCVAESERLEHELESLLTTSSLPEFPDYTYVDCWVRSIYWDTWRANESKELLLKRSELGVDIPTVH